MNCATYADVLRPSSRSWAIPYDVLVVLGGSLLMAACARVAVPFWPVPITGQTFGVLLTAMLLGSRRAVACQVTYIAQGLVGLPVFAGGGAGIAHLLGPTGGYLLGFIAAAWLAGTLAEKGWDRSFVRCLAAMTVGTAVIFAFGLAWLGVWLSLAGSAGSVWMLGFVPFIPGAIVKIALAGALLPIGWKLMGRPGPEKA
jgi:biotin transport system substrate-specific component